MRRRFSSTLWAVALTLPLVGCQALMQEKGNILKPEEVARIQEKKSTREEVFQILGSPAFVNTYQPNRWIYIHDRRFEGFRMVNRLEITFDDKGVVQQVQRNFDKELKDPRDLAGYDENTSWYQRWKLGKPHDETKLASSAPPTEDRAWWKFWGKKPAPPVMASPAKKDVLDVLPKQPSLWERLTDFTIQGTKPKAPEPETTFKPEEGEWWKNIFEKDPTQGPAKAPSVPAGGDTAKEILEGGGSAPKPAAPSPAAPETEAKSWWKFW